MAPQLSKPDRSLKRGRNEADNFFQKRKVTFPKYHVIHSEQQDKQARIISPFLVSKCLTETLGIGYKLSKMASGDLLLELCDNVQHSKLSNLTSIGEIPVSVTPHRSLNTVRGVISKNDFLHITEKEMLEGLIDQDVIDVHRIKIRKDNKEIDTKHMILTFNTSTLPDTIDVGYLKINVRPYIPNPRRCFNCQTFGHGSQSCRGRKTCAKCASKDHQSDVCDAALCCPNCEGEHAAYSRACPSWKKEKEIITIKTKENISFKEARRRFALTNTFSFTAKQNFADVVRRGVAPHSTPAPAKAAPTEPMAGPSTPQAGSAKAALSLPKQGPPVHGSASRRTSPRRERPETDTTAAARSSSTSVEVMDTTPTPPPLQPRNSSLERKKDRPLITGPPHK
ncbi:uncharacterized protein LOC144101708 isoform X1 [Amblyomma americanum]